MSTATPAPPDDAATLRREAAIFGAYLIGVEPHGEAVDLYIKAMRHKTAHVSPIDQARLDFVRKQPWAIRLIDPGLALVNPASEVRRRIYVMFSVLEAAPQYHAHFLPRRRKWWYIFVIGLAGVWGAVKTVVGALLVKAIK